MFQSWTSDFELDIAGRSPGDLADLCSRRGPRFDGLRVRISGEQLRARYVIGAAASAPLLKAHLVSTASGTRVVGRIHRRKSRSGDPWTVLFEHSLLDAFAR